MTIYNDITVVTICIITEIKYLLKKQGGWGNHGQGLFWTWWGNLIDMLIFNKIFINIRKNTT